MPKTVTLFESVIITVIIAVIIAVIIIVASARRYAIIHDAQHKAWVDAAGTSKSWGYSQTKCLDTACGRLGGAIYPGHHRFPPRYKLCRGKITVARDGLDHNSRRQVFSGNHLGIIAEEVPLI